MLDSSGGTMSVRAYQVPTSDADDDGEDALDLAALAHDLPDADADEQHGEQQEEGVDRRAATAQLGGVGVAEEGRPGEQPAGAPVAEDHGREADVAATAGLPVTEDVGGHEGEEATAEAGQTAGDEDGDELVAQHVDAERLGRDRGLADRAQPQAEGRAPEDPPVAMKSRTARIVTTETLVQKARRMPARSEMKKMCCCSSVPRASDRPGMLIVGSSQRRRLGGSATGERAEEAHREVLREAERHDVERDTGDDVVDAEGHGGDAWMRPPTAPPMTAPTRPHHGPRW